MGKTPGFGAGPRFMDPKEVTPGRSHGRTPITIVVTHATGPGDYDATIKKRNNASKWAKPTTPDRAWVFDHVKHLVDQTLCIAGPALVNPHQTAPLLQEYGERISDVRCDMLCMLQSRPVCPSTPPRLATPPPAQCPHQGGGLQHTGPCCMMPPTHHIRIPRANQYLKPPSSMLQAPQPSGQLLPSQFPQQQRAKLLPKKLVYKPRDDSC